MQVPILRILIHMLTTSNKVTIEKGGKKSSLPNKSQHAYQISREAALTYRNNIMMTGMESVIYSYVLWGETTHRRAVIRVYSMNEFTGTENLRAVLIEQNIVLHCSSVYAIYQCQT